MVRLIQAEIVKVEIFAKELRVIFSKLERPRVGDKVLTMTMALCDLSHGQWLKNMTINTLEFAT